ncbi:MAG: hypothetical protein ACX939_03805 [Hyphococcus sp.]
MLLHPEGDAGLNPGARLEGRMNMILQDEVMQMVCSIRQTAAPVTRRRRA